MFVQCNQFSNGKCLLFCEKIENFFGENMFFNVKLFFFSKKHHLCGIPPLPPKKVCYECLKEQIAIHVDNFIIVNNIHD
jgi:hypothetical protein